MNMRVTLDIPHFTDWVRKQDPLRSYRYGDGADCAVARYLKDFGFTEVYVLPGTAWGCNPRGEYCSIAIPNAVENNVVSLSASRKTFGQLLHDLAGAT